MVSSGWSAIIRIASSAGLRSATATASVVSSVCSVIVLLRQGHVVGRVDRRTLELVDLEVSVVVAGPPHRQVAQGRDLVEGDGALAVELQQRQEAGHPGEGVGRVAAEGAEGQRAG